MIVTYDYYVNDFGGYTGNYSEHVVTKNIKMSEMMVNTLTYNVLINGTYEFDKLHQLQQDTVKQVICMITEYYLTNGGYLAVQSATGNSGAVQSATVGKFSYASNSGSVDNSLSGQLPLFIIELLASTGLMYSGIAVSALDY